MSEKDMHRCPTCQHDTRTVSPKEHELQQAEYRGRGLGMQQAARLVRQSGWLVFSCKVADALEYAAEAYTKRYGRTGAA